MDPSDVVALGAAGLAAAVHRGELSAREAVDAHIARIEQVEPRLNALTVDLFDRARVLAGEADRTRTRDDPRAPLAGVPVTIKDQYDVEGAPTTWGLPSRVDHRPHREGPLLRRLRRAGAIPLAKTNVPVLLLEGETRNAAFGVTNNPWNLDRTPGGSSGGEAALIAAGASPLGLGGDYGGSLRVPAHSCGIATLMPTAGRLPTGDNPADFPLWHTLIAGVAGPMARTVADVALGYRVLATGRDDLAPEPGVAPVQWRSPDEVEVAGLRVAMVQDDGPLPVSAALRRAVREAAGILEERGATIVVWDGVHGAEPLELYVAITSADGAEFVRRQLGDDPPSPTLELILRASRLPAPVARGVAGLARRTGQDPLASVVGARGDGSVTHFGELTIRLQRLRRRVARRFHDEGVDALLLPPHALPALRHDTYQRLLPANGLTWFANLLGVPAGVVPVTRVRPREENGRSPGLDAVGRLAARTDRHSAGLPVGVQVLTPWWREDTALAVMAAIEDGARNRPDWPERPPAVPARLPGGAGAGGTGLSR